MAANQMELVDIVNNDVVTTSLKIAEILGKQHNAVISKIRTLSAEIAGAELDEYYNPKFVEKIYSDAQGRPRPYFEMNRDGFIELVGNMTGVKARELKRRYHAAFNSLMFEVG